MPTLEEQEEAVRIAAREWELPKAGVFDEMWRQTFLVMRLADLLSQLAIRERLYYLPQKDREWLVNLATSTVDHALRHYSGTIKDRGDA